MDLDQDGQHEQADQDGQDVDAFEGEGNQTGAPGDPVEELRALVAYLATNLVDEPDEVEVTAEQRGSAVHLHLRVPANELGKVIGRQGRIARALRTTLMIAGSRNNLRASLDIDG